MIKLFEHNKTAYDSAVQMLSETGKAAVIHPTGTGKSFIGFKLCEDNPDKKVLWLSPSEYIFKTQLENLKETGAEVPENITFMTYAKLMLLNETEISELFLDITIYDEYHRTGGACWQEGVNRLIKAFPNVPMLGLSATNIRYLDNQRDMAEELFDGNIASEMTLGEAIVRGILNPPKYICSIYSYRKDLERYERRIAAAKNKAVRDSAEHYLDALRRALEKADGLDVIFDKHMTNRNGKYIVFCTNKEHMDEMISHVPEWFGKIDKFPKVYSVYSYDPTASKSFSDFKEDNSEHLKLLFCIDALNEGIHVDNISGVILLRPTVSPIIYKQQIGRALSAGKSKEPVIFDIVMNIENLYSIDSVKEEMEVAITYYRYNGEDDKIITEQFKIIDEMKDCLKLFNDLEKTLSATWDYMYDEVKQYYIEHGNLNIDKMYHENFGRSLCRWINTQRRNRGNGLLTDSQIALLDSIGMRWESLDDISWNKNFSAYKKYVEDGNPLNVPSDTIYDGVELGKWLIRIRVYHNSGIRSDYFTSEREKLLEEVGIIWDNIDYIWESNYQAALDYYTEHGDLEVPKGYIQNGVKLYNWLADLRKNYRNNKLTEEQVSRLNAIGMRWQSKKDIVFDKGFEEAKKYSEKHGKADAPLNYLTPDGYKLGVFLSKCREKYAKGKLSEEQIKLLDSINMVWNKSRKNDWDECFEKAKEYFQKHGNLNVPTNYTADGLWLNKWLNEQKLILQGKRKNERLTEEQVIKLSAISLTAAEPRDEKWLKKYGAVKKYYDTHGDIKLPINYTDSTGQNLYTWLTNQKISARSGKMSDTRRKLLNDIGALSG